MTYRKLLPLLFLALLLQAEVREIRIEYPNGGEVLKRGGEVRVLWRSVGMNGNLAILLFKSGEQFAVIAESAPDCGFFQWKIPADLPESGQYRLRICSLRDLRVNDFSDRDFAITK
jgi:hypothetical protein